MRLAGLDIATRTGLAVVDGDRLIHAEAFKAAGETDGELFWNFELWLGPKLQRNQVRAVGIEQPLRTDLKFRDDLTGELKGASNQATYRRLYGLCAIAHKVCHSLDLPCHEVNQSAWRKAFLGNGKADKPAAMRQCQLLRWKVPNLDAAEACGVAWWLGGHLRLTRGHRPGELFSGAA